MAVKLSLSKHDELLHLHSPRLSLIQHAHLPLRHFLPIVEVAHFGLLARLFEANDRFERLGFGADEGPKVDSCIGG